MKIISLFFIFTLSFSVYSQSTPDDSSGRQGKVINSNWTFNYFPSEFAEKGYEAPLFDDSKWIAVSIPHTWNTYEITGGLPGSFEKKAVNNEYWQNGWGWYRKHFSINQAYSEKKVFIEFGSVMSYCKIWINGVYLGDHKGGYRSFDFDLTPHIKKGADNVIAVAVNNRKGEGDYYLYGGILKEVSIVLKNKLYIPMHGSATQGGGTLVTTPGFDGKTGVIKALTWVRNEDVKSKSCVLQTTIYDAAGKIVQQMKSTAEIKADQLYTFDQTSKPMKNLHAWTPADPYNYYVVSEIIDGKKIADSYRIPFRFFTGNDGNETADRNFFNAEDTAWIITERSIGVHDFSGTNQTTLKENGEADVARIVLGSSISRFPADRSSIAVITADLIDRAGKKAGSEGNTFRWVVTGPAKLIGPPVYRTDRSFTNVIRSTGEQGKIKVMVFSPGIASGSVELFAEEVARDNSIIIEPILRNEGRTGTERIILKPSGLETSPLEIKQIPADLRIASTGRDGYKPAIRDLIAKANPSIDTSSFEFRTLVELLSEQLYNNNGNLPADDFNFNAEHYNLSRLIAGYIAATKLPQPFKDGLRVYYSNAIIKEGDEKNPGDEMNWLNWIPSGGTVVYSAERAAAPSVKGTLVSQATGLTDLISVVHPQFINFSADAKARAIEFIAKMNPFVHADPQDRTKLVAERGKPVLIPLLKFIAE